MTTTGKFLTGIACTMMAITVARADAFETFTHTTPTQSVPFTDTFLLEGFDTSLGTLDSITLTLDATGTAQVDVINLSGTAQPFSDATANIPITLTGPAGITTSVSLTAGPFSGTATTPVTTLSGSPETVDNSVSVPSADFGPYEGSGFIVSLTVDAGAGSFSGSGNPGQVAFGGTATASAITTIDYTYTPATTTTVPEPATVTLLGVSLLGISGLLRRFSPQR